MITAASAFHWFDSEKFKNECRRILSPGGYVALLINARGYDDFTRRQHTLCEKYGVNFVSLAHGYDKTKHLASSFFYGEYQELRFPHPLTYTNADFLARSLSSSYAPLPDNPSYIPYVEELTQLVNQYSRNNMLFLPSHATILFWGRV